MFVLNQIPDWQAPSAPAQYPDLTAVKCVRALGRGIAWHLDFSRHDSDSDISCERFFASDAMCCPIISWPWIAGFTPEAEDFYALGFIFVEIIDQSDKLL